MLYFCGHGVEKDSQYLLLEDFGDSPLSLLENSLDVGRLYQAMARCKARTQYFFVDACRDVPFKLLERLSGDSPMLMDQRPGPARSDSALLFATSGGAKAYGTLKQMTRYTEALIRALDGLGAVPAGPDWVITIPGVHQAVTHQLDHATPKQPRQKPTTHVVGASPVHRCERPPIVPVVITCAPSAAIRSARAALNAVYNSHEYPGSVTSECWSYQVPPDRYRFSVTFPHGGFQPIDSELWAWPPGLDHKVVIQP
jgi:hypothetical protein